MLRKIKCEVRRLRRVILLSKSKKNNDCKELDKGTVLNLLKWIVKWGFMEMLTNITAILRIFLTLCISVATRERSFSKLKLAKTYLRSQMSQLRLSSLAMLFIEREVSNRLKYDEIIKDFDVKKARK